MADMGDIIGSLMSGLIRARRIADEQTAALAEYYKENPLLEGLSIPRIRIPELTIDMPLLIEDQVLEKIGEMGDPEVIAKAVKSHLKSTLLKNNIKITPAFQKIFANEVKNKLDLAKKSGLPIMKETFVRNVQSAFSDTLIKTKISLTSSEKETIANELRTKITSIKVDKKSVAPGIMVNVKTADVKEQSSDANVVRLKITLKEEGLEWAVQSSESGGVIRTLQPE